jgi:peptidoglycan hydrolase CwlO-like protein
MAITLHTLKPELKEKAEIEDVCKELEREVLELKNRTHADYNKIDRINAKCEDFRNKILRAEKRIQELLAKNQDEMEKYAFYVAQEAQLK